MACEGPFGGLPAWPGRGEKVDAFAEALARVGEYLEVGGVVGGEGNFFEPVSALPRVLGHTTFGPPRDRGMRCGDRQSDTSDELEHRTSWNKA